MPKKDYTIKLLGLEDFEVKSLDETKDKFWLSGQKELVANPNKQGNLMIYVVLPKQLHRPTY